MANRWKNNGNSDRLYFLGLQNHCRWDCSHEIKRHLLLGRKAMTNLDSILKSRDISLPTKVPLVKAMVFPVVMYGCESWTIKKAECRRTDVLNYGIGRRFLRVPWTARRSNQSILKEISPEFGRTDAEAETPIFRPPHVKNWLTGQGPDARKDWRQEEKGTTEDEMVSWHHRLNGHEFEQAPGVGTDREAWHATVRGVAKSWTQLSAWLNWPIMLTVSGFCVHSDLSFMFVLFPPLNPGIQRPWEVPYN